MGRDTDTIILRCHEAPDTSGVVMVRGLPHGLNGHFVPIHELLDRNGLGEVPRLVHVAPPDDGHAVGEALER